MSTFLFVLVFLVFLGLKVTHHVAWSWWVVCTPLMVLGVLTAASLATVISVFRRIGR